MNSLKKTELTPLSKGEEFLLLKVTAETGAVMPTHHATSEAIVTVKREKQKSSFQTGRSC